MKYNKQYALLKVKTEAIENLLCKADNKHEQIERCKNAEQDLDGWYQEQAENLELELNAIHQIIDIIAK